MPVPTRKILITTALPYANGSIHLGHILEYIQADIFVRFQRMKGHECYFICGHDAHGTPIMLAAEKAGLSPEELIEQVGKQQYQDIMGFNISFDHFYTTHSPENQQRSTLIFKKLEMNGDITVKTIEQAFDSQKNMFLPDRYIKGECPKCGAKEQYGDSCENCGATYSPMEMKNPVSVLSETTPVTRTSEHLFFQLERYREQLTQWVHSGTLQPEVTHKLEEWLNNELYPWDISRDAPYFGFEIPGYSNKYFYVWLDAPIGYMASFDNYCQKNSNVHFDEFWQASSTTELYHFIGKDITYFHSLFWPAMLKGAGYRTPTAVYTHGFLTINGQKMSKSRGTFISARNYLNYFEPEALRYYFAAKLNANVEDVDLNLDDFIQRVNSDLVGKIVNIASRCASFIHKKFAGKLASVMDNPALFEHLQQRAETISHYYDSREFAKAVREIMELADRVNHYIDDKKPWALAKNELELPLVHSICTSGLNLFYLLIIYLKPIVPLLAEKAEFFLNCGSLTWDSCNKTLLDHEIQAFQALMTRIEREKITEMLENNKS